MSKRVEFFFDYVSSYSYLANSQLNSLGDAEVIYRPAFLGGIMKATGNAPPLTVPARGKYLFEDIARWAKRYGIVFNLNPRFPQNTLGALRLALHAMHEGRFKELHPLLFDAMWVHGRNLEEADVLRELAQKAGLDAERALAMSGDEAIKAELKANTDEAVARGAFGAPTFFVGDQMFFGNDRLDFVRDALG